MSENPDVTKARRALVDLCVDLAALERHKASDPANDETLASAARSLEAAIDTTAYVLTETIGLPPKG